jgi:hypothetical protein
MPISSITTNDTFGLLVTRTSQLITGYNALESSGAVYSSATANNGWLQANTARTHANSAFANGNSNFTIFQVASNVANAGWLQANTARTHANNAFLVANAAFANSNTNFTIFQVASGVANNGWLQANTARTHANNAFLAANASFANGNTNFAVLQSAFLKANNALPNATGTFAGTLTVTGDIIGKIASNTNTTVIRIATGSEFRTGTSRSTALAPADVFDAAAEVSLTDATTITIDMATGFNFNVNLTSKSTRTVATPSNMKAGQSGYIRIKQGSGATAQTISTFGPGWNFSGGVPPVLSTGMGNTDLLFYQTLSTANVFGSLSKDLRLNY